MNETDRPVKKVGRPRGWKKPGGIRKQRQFRLYDDEYELVKKFSKLLKGDHRKVCEEFLAEFKIEPKGGDSQ